jgi:hypothetical protein
MSQNTKLLDLIFVQRASKTMQDLDDALSAMGDVLPTGYRVQGCSEMVGRCIAMCIQQRTLIGRLTFAGHGAHTISTLGSSQSARRTLSPATEIPIRNR